MQRSSNLNTLSRTRAAAITTILVASFGCAGQSPRLPPASVVWERSFDHSLKFHAIVDERLIVVGTERHLYGLDRSSGTRLWRERNVNPQRGNLIDVPSEAYLLVADSAGGRFDDLDTHILAISKANGMLRWESEPLEGQALQGVLQIDEQRLVMATVGKPHGDDRGFMSGALPGKGLNSGLKREPVLVGLDLQSGATLWQRPIGREVRLRPAPPLVGDDSKDVLRPFDLDNYHTPLILGTMVCVTYHGVACFSARTGEQVWEQSFPVLEDELGLAYANPLVTQDRLYATGNNRIYALDPATGEIVWRSSKADYLPEIMVDDNLVYAQLGGRFFDLDRERWLWRGDFGAMATDRRTGKHRWRFDDANDSVTNLLILHDRIWLADEDRLFSLDRGSGKVMLRKRHGMSDEPVFAVLNGRAQLVLVSQSEAAAFDTGTGERLWYVEYPPPRPGVWRRLSAQLLQVSGTLLKIGSTAISLTSGVVPSVPAIPVGGIGLKLFSTKSVVSRTTGRAGERMSGAADSLTESGEFADLGSRYQYFLTEVDGHDGVSMATVDIDTGRTVGIVGLPAATPDIVIDDETGLLYQADNTRLLAIKLRGDQLGLALPAPVRSAERKPDQD